MSYFYKHYFAPQNVEPQNRIFSPEHLIISTTILLFIVGMLFIQRKKQNRRFSSHLLTTLAAIMLAFEVFRIGWDAWYFGFDLRNIRFDWCNQICIALPIIVLFKWEKAYPFIDVLAVMGGMTVIIYPLWVFYDYGGVHTLAVQSMLSHGLMVLIPLSMPFTTTYRPNLKKVWKPLVGIWIICLIAFFMSNLLNVNYLLMLEAQDVPVLNRIPYPRYWLLAAPVLAGAVVLVTGLLSRFDKFLLRETF